MTKRRLHWAPLTCGFLFTLLLGAPYALADQNSGLRVITTDHAQAIVGALADDAMKGRAAGKAGGHKAGDWIAKRLQELGVDAPAEGYFQPFGSNMRNVLGTIPGTSTETVVIGAHYDHLGPGNGIYNGADDNASGCAAVLEIARAFKASGVKPRRTVVFAFFDGEELGKLGSKHYTSVDRSTVMMINFDMVGRMHRRTVRLSGMQTSPHNTAWVDAAAAKVARLRVKRLDGVSSSSDHAAFHAYGVPILMLHTSQHTDYHQPSDESRRIDHDGIVKIAKLGFLLAHQAANSTEDLASAVAPRSKSAQASAKAMEINTGASQPSRGLSALDR